MRRLLVFGLMIALSGIVSAPAVNAQGTGTTVYYVQRNYTGCEDGSMKCPFNTVVEAENAGRKQVCAGSTFEIDVWNSDTAKYEYYDTVTGGKPTPSMGLPLATSVQIALLALIGVLLVTVGLVFRARVAHNLARRR